MTTVTRVSLDEFMTADFPRGAQLIEGEVVVHDPTLLHQEVCARLLELLRSLPAGGLAGFGGNWVVAPDTVLVPDVWWVGPERLASIDIGEALVAGPPDLAVEVRSPSTWALDAGRKRALYEAAGLPELWLVDPSSTSLLVLRRSAPGVATFDVFVEAGEGDALVTPLLPGFVVQVGALFPLR